MPLYIGRKKVCPIVPTWRGFWSVTVYGFPGTIVDCGTQKTIGEDGRVVFRFAEAGTYTFIGMKGSDTQVLEVELVEGEYYVRVNMYIGITYLEYAESDGLQAVDTEFDVYQNIMTPKRKYQLKFMPYEPATSYRSHWGATDGTSTSRQGIRIYSENATSWVIQTGSTDSSPVTTLINYPTKNVIHTLEINTQQEQRTEVKLDNGTSKFSSAASGFEFSGTVILFNNRLGDSIVKRNGFSGRFYEMTVTENNKVIGHFVPVKDSDGIVCILDDINNKLLYNLTDTPLVPGPEVA
ncbi:MAG: hypothetical protein MJZ20_02755 [Bacteroidaceae bacterium]|nr:hypothetical protein [Bacteroidaceae bacterium]